MREATSDSNYGNDYKELSSLKTIADKYGITILLVHHLRKTKDDDPFNMISGTTGLSGCVDGSFVLMESKRGSRIAKLFCVGRDIENQELIVHFDNADHKWTVDEQSSINEKKKDDFVNIVWQLMKTRDVFVGTATELKSLLERITERELFPNRITRDLVQHSYELEQRGVSITTRRVSECSVINALICSSSPSPMAPDIIAKKRESTGSSVIS